MSSPSLIDITTNMEGKRFYLTADGTILAREPFPDIANQHIPLHLRPEWAMVKVTGPDTVHRVTRICAGHQWDLECLAGGRLFRRVSDVKAMNGNRFVWREVEIELTA